MRAVAGAHFSEETPLKDMLRWHIQHHPAMEGQDKAKLYFQAVLGCGHLLGDEALVARRITEELATQTPNEGEPLTEPLGPDYVRLNLRRAMAEDIPALWIARLMKRSMPSCLPPRSKVVDELAQLNDPSLEPYIQRLQEDETWLPNHSAAYHQAYAPAYRVISRQCVALLPSLIAAAKLSRKDQVLICIDGPCGSGKSTTAALLGSILDAAIVPMDDFFLPHPAKTPQRLAQPGGNADWERVVEEFLQPWLRGEAVAYRPYDCHTGSYASPVTVPKKHFTILEGSYSLMPAISQHADLRIFLQIDQQTQHQRILARNGEQMLKMFIQRWIPLEQAYFSAYSLPNESCLVLSTVVQG